MQMMQATLMENRYFMKEISDHLLRRGTAQKPIDDPKPEKGDIFKDYLNPYEDT